MTQKFNNLIDLVKIVTEMERDLGLNDISKSERNVLLAISDLENSEGIAKTKAILSHNLTVGISRPSIFRALAKLEKLGKLSRKTDTNGAYELI
jgi:Mn-dependent DtxR family transcriptional regulator